jgi:flagellar basal body-associated protein FliL
MFLLLVTLISLVVAVIMAVIAWHVSQEERRRSEARVAALAAEIREGRPAALETTQFAAHSAIREPALGSPLFAASPASHTSTRLGVIAAIGFIVFVSAAAVAVVLGRSAGHDGSAAESGADEPAAATVASQTIPPNPPAPMPLELIALGHERDGDRLTVRGVIRNPQAGAEVDHVTAVVFLFNADGGFVSSGRAAVESAALVPGGESAFLVTVRGATDVVRYRVSFRSDDRVVPHVDRRDHMQEKG